MERSLPLVLLLACAHPAAPAKPTEVTAPAPPPTVVAPPAPPAPWAAALARFQTERPLAPLFPPDLLTVGAIGRVGDLARLPGGTLGYVERGCEIMVGCGCEVRGEYRYGRDGDRIVIAHLVPDVEVTRVVHPGACGAGCGVAGAEPRNPVIDLGAIDAAKVERVEVHYPLARTEETCEEPRPAQ
jgi:hypothetical protein